MTPLPEQDEDLMLLVRDTDSHAAFEALVRRHTQNLLNYFGRCGVQQDAEDLAQKVFLRLYRYRGRYRVKAKFTTFLYLLARQVWIDDLRRRSRREREFADAQDEGRNIADDRPVSDASHVDNRADVRRALDTLPDAMRQVVVLGAFEERPYAEIAEILGIPEGTVKSRMFNALAKMKAFLLKDGTGTEQREGKRTGARKGRSEE